MIARIGLTVGFDLSDCLNAGPSSALNEARDQTVIYNKPFVDIGITITNFDLCSLRYTRAIPYLAGIALAYFYADKGGKHNTQPANLPKNVVTLGWVITAVTMAFCIYGTYKENIVSGPEAGTCTWGKTQSYMYMSFSTLGWAFCIFWIVFCGLFGYGGPVTHFLALDFWGPLSRLVYGSYIIHPMLLYILYYSGNKMPNYYAYRATFDVLGTIFAAFGASFLAYMVIEKPLNNVQKIILPAGR